MAIGSQDQVRAPRGDLGVGAEHRSFEHALRHPPGVQRVDHEPARDLRRPAHPQALAALCLNQRQIQLHLT